MPEMKVGQIWESIDPREGPKQKIVLKVLPTGRAIIQSVAGGRLTTVDCTPEGTKAIQAVFPWRA